MTRKHWFLFLLSACLAVFSPASLRGADRGLPSADQVLRQLLDHARAAQAPDGYYLCTKQTVTDELDSSGHITSRKVKLGESRPSPREAKDASKWSTQNGFSIDQDLLQRYQFTVVDREIINGRSSLVLTFLPKDPPLPPLKFQDRLLNRAMGTVWIDEQDHELAKASLCLGQPVSFGILGAVDIVTFNFERARTADGAWLTKWTDAYFKGRKFVIPVQIRKRVDCTDFRKLEPEAEPARNEREARR